LKPRIIDRDEGPTPLSKAVGVSARSLELLEPSGVTGRLLAEGLRIRHGVIRSAGRRLGRIDFSALPHRFDFLLSLPQSRTEEIMAEVLRGLGLEVEWRKRLAGLEFASGELRARIAAPAGEAETGFDLVYGADGARSAVREAAGVAFEGRTHRRTWSIADAEIAGWPYEPGAAQVFLHPGGDVGFIIPIGPDRFRAVSNTPDAMARIPGAYRIARLLRTDTFELPIRQAATYQRDGVFLGGDAAHVHSPVGARGMNLGIEDAAAFARRLAEGDLDGYTAERRPVGRRWIVLSERLLALAQTPSPLLAAVRDAALAIVGHASWLQRPALERVAGVRE
jgi:2-polyprenyl-6-methoxyphenol hydroxylase-like FAD-dependent oxidoreductase